MYRLISIICFLSIGLAVDAYAACEKEFQEYQEWVEKHKTANSVSQLPLGGALLAPVTMNAERIMSEKYKNLQLCEQHHRRCQQEMERCLYINNQCTLSYQANLSSINATFEQQVAEEQVNLTRFLEIILQRAGRSGYDLNSEEVLDEIHQRINIIELHSRQSLAQAELSRNERREAALQEYRRCCVAYQEPEYLHEIEIQPQDLETFGRTRVGGLVFESKGTIQ